VVAVAVETQDGREQEAGGRVRKEAACRGGGGFRKGGGGAG